MIESTASADVSGSGASDRVGEVAGLMSVELADEGLKRLGGTPGCIQGAFPQR